MIIFVTLLNLNRIINYINQHTNKMKAFFDKFQSLKGSSFIAINGYESTSTGEIANHLINVNISVENAKKNDLLLLETCNENDLLNISETSKIALDICKTALSEMQTSLIKNISADKSEHTAQSQAQTDAYIHLTPAIKLHKETMQVHIFGQAMKKTVLVKGVHKTVNSAPKTLAKNAIKKYLDLRTDKFRNFLVGNLDEIKINGETIQRVK